MRGVRALGSSRARGEFGADGPRNAARDEVSAPPLSNRRSKARRRQKPRSGRQIWTRTGAGRRDERTLAEAEARRKEAADAAQREAESEAARRREEEAQRTAAVVEEEKRASERQSLTRSLQTALGKVGCYPGNVTGQWDAEGRAALAQFARRAKVDLAVDEPTIAALTAVLVRTDRVCPLECDGDKVESNGKCVPGRTTPSLEPRRLRASRDRPRRASATAGYDPSRSQSARHCRRQRDPLARNSCQTVPKGCHAVRWSREAGGMERGKIVCP
jgi:hypothetical protein